MNTPQVAPSWQTGIVIGGAVARPVETREEWQARQRKFEEDRAAELKTSARPCVRCGRSMWPIACENQEYCSRSCAGES